MPVKIAIVGGTGHFGLNHLRAFQRASYAGLAQCVAASGLPHETEILEERARQFPGFRGYTDWKEMIDKEDVDGVTVVTPDFLHKEMALYALEAGKHVLVEKPLDVTVDGCEQITALAEKKGLLLEVDFHKRHDPQHILMRQKITAGELGTIQYGYAHMEDKIEVPRDWLKSWAAKSSPNWFLGIHFYDLVRWMIGSNAVSVTATGRKGKLEEIGIGGWDAIQAHVQFENGAQVTFQTSWILPDGFEAIVNQGVRLVGTEGVLECDTQDRGTMTCTVGEGMKTWNPSFLRTRVDKQGREIYEGYGIDSILDFVENIAHLKNGGSLGDLAGMYPSGRDGIEATRIAEGVGQSITKGSVVDV